MKFLALVVVGVAALTSQPVTAKESLASKCEDDCYKTMGGCGWYPEIRNARKICDSNYKACEADCIAHNGVVNKLFGKNPPEFPLDPSLTAATKAPSYNIRSVDDGKETN